jgi:mannose-6-phosphate isomerase-like protein (cupin superfamily)
MIVHNLNEMIKGWFVGNFKPSAYETSACEVAVKKYVASDFESRHFHKVADEITVILSGRVRMNGCEYKSGDIIVIKAGESTDFLAIEDTITVVVKTPAASNDKYLAD